MDITEANIQAVGSKRGYRSLDETIATLVADGMTEGDAYLLAIAGQLWFDGECARRLAEKEV